MFYLLHSLTRLWQRLSLFRHWDLNFIIAGAICSCLIGASYPLTQVYQHEEDSRRGDKTHQYIIGLQGLVYFFGYVLFALGIAFLFTIGTAGMMLNFYFFLVCALPIFRFFNYWFYKVGKSTANANFKNAMRMNFLSSGCMLIYFGI
jgi:1,4-dihydroxy-2-naphthoate octaprenyltransferase